MVLPLVCGQRMDGFLLETKPCPLKFITPTNENNTGLGFKLILNANYEQWVTLDQCLKGWFLGSISPSVAIKVIDMNTSREVWKEDLFGSTNRSQ